EHQPERETHGSSPPAPCAASRHGTSDGGRLHWPSCSPSRRSELNSASLQMGDAFMQQTPTRGAATGNSARSPVVMRSKMFLEVASELVGTPGWNDRQVNIQFREQGAPEWRLNLFASDTADAIDVVASGQADIAICNPGAILAMALHGLGPYKEPIPVRAITVFPQLDRLGFAIAKRTGVTSLTQIKERQLPLKVS